MDGTEVTNRGISLFLGRASDRHCSRLTLEIGTINRTTASVAQYEEGAFNQHSINNSLIAQYRYLFLQFFFISFCYATIHCVQSVSHFSLDSLMELIFSLASYLNFNSF